jgi:hypothetical protein
MAIDNKLFLEARENFWTEYHKKIEELGFQLSRQGMMRGDEGISILATIQPHYSPKVLKKIRKIIPEEYVYRGEKIKVYIFPSVSDLASRFGA